ncbi:hypothetical protein [Ruegeria arenilitoris]|uniref:hypothetical protein n=1 Tax=Ruegeria arenilitoris TaxID=1173585 RepID=UPI00147D574B|nr:hypothetical protein [Ruegeria arenilitoris]
MAENDTKVLILGSAPAALAARDWARGPFTHIVAINNAWRIREDWDFLIHPEDFPAENRPDCLTATQRIVTAQDYVPIQNAYGGFVYAGGTMAFTAGYWALGALKPSVMAFFGCDMVYPRSGNTHFYGQGTADPLRADVTLRSLEAKSARLALLAARQDCNMVRLSSGPSRLVYPSVSHTELIPEALPRTEHVDALLQAECEVGYVVPSGRYWEVEKRFDPAVVDRLDAAWLAAYKASALDQAA